jgi:hypothetical protein
MKSPEFALSKKPDISGRYHRTGGISYLLRIFKVWEHLRYQGYMQFLQAENCKCTLELWIYLISVIYPLEISLLLDKYFKPQHLGVLEK